jgi:hypothetical protein
MLARMPEVFGMCQCGILGSLGRQGFPVVKFPHFSRERAETIENHQRADIGNPA